MTIRHSPKKTMKTLLLISSLIALPSIIASAQETTGEPVPGASGNKGGFDFRLFKPSAKIFFDTGSDDTDEIDIFDDGSLNASIDLVNLIHRYDTGADFYNTPDSTLWWGPSLGAGITSPADDSADGSQTASDAPVLLLSLGLFFEYDVSNKTSVLIETGYALGLTSDESFGDKTDGAIYFGLSLDF